MNTNMKLINRLPWAILIMGSLTLGLAPFSPEPHLLQKLRMLFSGELSSPVDVFDLCLHGIFPLLLSLKVIALVRVNMSSPNT